MIDRFIRRHRLLLSAAAALFIVLAIVAVSYRNVSAALEASRWVAHTHDAISAIEETLARVQAADSAMNAYVITGNEAYASAAAATGPQVAAGIERVRSLVADNPQQAQQAALLAKEIDTRLQSIAITMAVRRHEGLDAARRVLVSGGSNALDPIRARAGHMIAAERALLDARQQRFDVEGRRTLIVLTIGSFADVFLVAIIVILVLRDFERQRELRRALVVARDSALSAADARAQFLANMSHEIRTPLNAIVGMSSLLLTTGLDDDQRDMADTVRTSADALLTVINDILDFSKIEAGKLLIETSDINLRATVESVVDLFSEPARAKKLEIGALFDAAIPPLVRGDGGRIRQVLSNLVANAVKFTSDGEVIVHLNVVKDDDRTVHVRFAVTDTGIGIEDEVLQRLFQPFTQADASTTRKFGGTGLGLAISRQLVELMNGTIGADSVEGKGSTFWFMLPLDRSAATVEDAHAVDLEGLRVLIVDDNRTNRLLLRHNLEAWHMRTDEADTAQQALTLLRNAARDDDAYRLAIVDLVMPGMDGMALARAIHSDAAIAATRVIMLTSLGDRIAPDVMSGSGIDTVLTKPVKQSALFDAIVSVVAGSAPAKRTQPVQPGAATRADVRVLVAEDNPVNQKLAVRQLQRFGIEADAVANGKEAVDAVALAAYDLVFMDVQMPEMDGFEATREIRARDGARHTVIVALTANALAGDREKCIEAGMDDYLAKPVAESELARVLEQWLPAPPVRAAEEAIAPGTIEYLRDLGGSDANFLQDLVDLYVDDASQRIHSIRAAIESKKASDLATAAHALKSSAGNVGAMTVRSLAQSLEQLGRDGTTENAARIADQLEAEHARAVDQLRAETS